MAITSRTKRILTGVAGSIGSVAGIVAFMATVFDWPVRETTACVAAAVAGLFLVGYIIDRMIWKVNKSLDERLTDIKGLINENEKNAIERNRAQDLILCRLELIHLIRHQPENKVAIEKKAHQYFCELGGNDWMGSTYSEWAEKHGGDVDIMFCETNL